MNCKAANEQQQEARWRIFLMFVVMALMVIRTGLVSRGVIAVLSAGSGSQDAAPMAHRELLSASPADVRNATLVLLCLAEAAGRLVIVKERMVWELMNQPLPRQTHERPINVASLFERPSQRLDSS
ncbi:MAG: hypothetical protein AB7P20_10645 [Rhizobiaceae bacterium]